MDLLGKAQNSNKEAYFALIDKYNVIFYKVARIYFSLDKEISSALEKALKNSYKSLINYKTEKDFLIVTIKEIIRIHEENNKKNSSNDSESTKNTTKYKMYKSDSIVEQCMEELEEKNRIIILLYYYANLNEKEISSITHVSKKQVLQIINENKSNICKCLNIDNQNGDIDNLIKSLLQKDNIYDNDIFENILISIRNSKIKVSSLSYNNQLILVFLLVLLIIIVALFFLNMYFGIFDSFIANNTNNQSVKNINNSSISNEANNLVNTSNLTSQNTTTNTINNATNNTSNSIKNNSINNTVEVIINTATNAVQNYINTSNSTHSNIIIDNSTNDFSEIDIYDLTKFVSSFAVGIERLSFDEENLESNTFLLYIAKHYFDTTSSNSLEINAKYASTAENIHKYLSEFTEKDYTNKDYIKSYNNYIGYTNISKSYTTGKDISVFSKEKYEVSDVKITSKYYNTYTATAKVNRKIEDEITNYIITFDFSVNQNYEYQQFCLKSLSARNLSFYPDNTTHLVEN